MSTDDLMTSILGMAHEPDAIAAASRDVLGDLSKHERFPELQLVILKSFAGLQAGLKDTADAALALGLQWFFLGAMAQRRASENQELERLTR